MAAELGLGFSVALEGSSGGGGRDTMVVAG